jgi:hypothetical protein
VARITDRASWVWWLRQARAAVRKSHGMDDQFDPAALFVNGPTVMVGLALCRGAKNARGSDLWWHIWQTKGNCEARSSRIDRASRDFLGEALCAARHSGPCRRMGGSVSAQFSADYARCSYFRRAVSTGSRHSLT